MDSKYRFNMRPLISYYKHLPNDIVGIHKLHSNTCRIHNKDLQKGSQVSECGWVSFVQHVFFLNTYEP